MSIQVTASRYAVLRDEEEDVIVKRRPAQRVDTKTKQASAPKSVAKTQKAKSKKKSGSSHNGKTDQVCQSNGLTSNPEAQLQEEQFLNDLQEAIVESKMCYEKEMREVACWKLERGLSSDIDADVSSNKSKRNKKGSKKGPVTLSLDEFLHQNHAEDTSTNHDSFYEMSDRNNDSDREDTFSQDFDNWERCFGDPSKNHVRESLGLPSRYDVLRDDDEEDGSSLLARRKPMDTAKAITTDSDKKPSKASANSANSKAKSARHKAREVKQWEEWKEIDEKIVDHQLYRDMEQACLQSRLEYEARMKLLREEKKSANKQKDKSTKPLMSLNHESHADSEKAPKMNGSDANGFAREESPAIQVIEINPNSSRNQKEHNEEVADPKKELKEKDELISKLHDENEAFQQEIELLKQKNAKLREILKSGEMREKTQILIQNERIKQVNEELTEEVSNLHVSLEQERSKVHELQDKLNRLLYNHQRRRSEDSGTAKH